MRNRFALLLTLALAAPVLAQGPAPRETVSVAVGGKKVSIEYGRPLLRGRSFDELAKQLPADRMWRAGANQVTTLTSEGDILLGGKRIAAGKYSLYVHVSEAGECSLAVNSDLGVALSKIWPAAPANQADELWPHLQDYDKNLSAKEVARAPMSRAILAAPVEVFTVSLKPEKSGALLTLTWLDRSFTVALAPPPVK
jgi:hypothetical protein